jgi:protein-tyrosine phosphatase
MVLPPPRDPASPYRLAVVCLGNICRSPMADVVLNHRVAAAGLDGRVEVASAGTGDWHVGDPMDRRAAALLTAHGYDASRHRAAQFESGWFASCDLVLAMDATNHADLAALAAAGAMGPVEPGRLMMFRDFDPRSHGDGDREVPDPYYGGDDGFANVLAMVERTCDHLVAELRRLLSPRPGQQPAPRPDPRQAGG